jgi:hypothetical protein
MSTKFPPDIQAEPNAEPSFDGNMDDWGREGWQQWFSLHSPLIQGVGLCLRSRREASDFFLFL